MNSSKAIIGKNLVLLSLVLITLLSLFRGLFNRPDLLLIQSVAGAVYLVFSLLEYSNASFKAKLPVERFGYYPGSYFSIRFIKAGIYLTFAFLLMFSPGKVSVLYPVCLMIGFTELIITLLKHKRKYCFVSLYVNYILIALDSIERIFAQDIDYIEYRHEIFFLIKKNGKAVSIKTFSVENKDVFIEKMKRWIQNNGVYIQPESRQKLHIA